MTPPEDPRKANIFQAGRYFAPHTMKFLVVSLCAFVFALITGCATRQQTVLVQAAPARKIVTAAQVADEGNSPEMDEHLASALRNAGLSVQGKLPAGTTRSQGVHSLVSYVDVWRWDLVMYLQSITIRLHDAATGQLLATGTWRDSPLHGFRNAQSVVQGVVNDMMAKVRGGAR